MAVVVVATVAVAAAALVLAGIAAVVVVAGNGNCDDGCARLWQLWREAAIAVAVAEIWRVLPKIAQERFTRLTETKRQMPIQYKV